MKVICIRDEANRLNIPVEATWNLYKQALTEKGSRPFFDYNNDELIVFEIEEIQDLINRLKTENAQIASISNEYGISTTQMEFVLNDLVLQHNLDGVITSVGEYLTDNSIRTRLLNMIEKDENIDLNIQSFKLGLPVRKAEEKIIKLESQVISAIKPYSQIKIRDISHEIAVSEKASLILLKRLIANEKIFGSIDMVNEVYIQDQPKIIPIQPLPKQDIGVRINNTGSFSFLDHKGGAEYPYPKNVVFNALLESIANLKGMKISEMDELSGRINVKGDISLWSWGENIPISVKEIWPERTRVEIVSTPKTGILFGGAFDAGKNKENIENILNETSNILNKKALVSPSIVTEVDTINGMYCNSCGAVIRKETEVCPKCGVRIAAPLTIIQHTNSGVSDLWYFVPLIFGILGGIIGWVAVKDRDEKKATYLVFIGVVSSLLWILFSL